MFQEEVLPIHPHVALTFVIESYLCIRALTIPPVVIFSSPVPNTPTVAIVR